MYLHARIVPDAEDASVRDICSGEPFTNPYTMTANKAIEATVRAAAERLAGSSESPRLDAELLVSRAIAMPRSYLFAHPDDILDDAAVARLEDALERRLGGTPMAYITGVREFWSLELMVSPATLVPRPETELLVEIALRELPRRSDAAVIDLGTGCGAIAIALAHERRLAAITAVDISAEALAVARENARQHLLDNIEFLEGDWTGPVAARRFQLIVSNPPYVAVNDPALGRLHAEPELALAAGSDGLDAIRRLADECRAVVGPDGALILEHGATQRDEVADLLQAYGWTAVRCYDDLAGHPRVTRAVFPASESSETR
jgi:release factor glutamine methyltransferase